MSSCPVAWSDIRRSQHNQCTFIHSLVTRSLDFHSVLDFVVKAAGATKNDSGLVASHLGFGI